jgi:hypothetical protein
MNDFQQRQLITDVLNKAIDSGKIKFEPPPPPPIIQEVKEPEPPSYEGGRVTIFDLLTCIMFTLNLLGLTNINWLLVFLPFIFPYVVFYGILWGMMLWTKFKNRKKKDNGITERAESKGKAN